MSSPSPPPPLETARYLRDGAQTVSLGAKGVYLISLLLIGLALVVSTLAAYQIQLRTKAVKVGDGQPISISLIRSFANTQNDNASELRNKERTLGEKVAKLNRLVKQSNEAAVEISILENELQLAIQEARNN